MFIHVCSVDMHRTARGQHRFVMITLNTFVYGQIHRFSCNVKDTRLVQNKIVDKSSLVLRCQIRTYFLLKSQTLQNVCFNTSSYDDLEI